MVLAYLVRGVMFQDVRAQSEHLAQLDAQRSEALLSLRRANSSSFQYDAQGQEALDEARQLHVSSGASLHD